MLLWVTGAAALCLIISNLNPSLSEPTPFQDIGDLCKNKTCEEGSVCRVVERCESNVSCALDAACVGPEEDIRSGCPGKLPLLNQTRDGKHLLRVCYTGNECPQEFFCSTLLADASSRCCPASSEPFDKEGTCREPSKHKTFFCVEQCRSDADCMHDYKCCQRNENCDRRECYPPRP